MNEKYLMQYISRHLHTIVRKYSGTGTLMESVCSRPDYHDSPVGDGIMSAFFSVCEKIEIPVMMSMGSQMIYACVHVPDNYFVVGPFRFSSPLCLNYQFTQNLPDLPWIDSIPSCEFDSISSCLLLIYNLFYTDTITPNDLLAYNCISDNDTIQKYYSELVFQNRESGKKHNPYDQEIREQKSIENGNLEQLKQSIEEDYYGELGTLAKNPVRNIKNLAIVVITLASRSAIRGGLLPEVAFSLSDSYIQKLEALNDTTSPLHLARKAEFQYTQMVREIKDQEMGITEAERNPYINKCKNYIFSHLHGKITVQEIADELGINPNYLSGLFKKCEHISLAKFIQKEKISLAKNLLIYSRYSYNEIAAYLGYSSQSHLGKQFKEETGYTLHAYREVYGKKDVKW